jgi:CRISPR system Cascade subunit CasD
MTDRRWLILRLEAPLAAFGGVTIDQVGVTRDFPAASMLTGLIGNALGLVRTDSAAHQRLQDRLVFAARRDRESPAGALTDMQNAKLEKNERGWTTWGKPEGRAGATYDTPHRRRRDYHPDTLVTVAMTLAPADEKPDLDAIAAALARPARPLFLGRKGCLPAAPLFCGEIVTLPTAFDALVTVPPIEPDATDPMRALWPAGEGPADGPCVSRVIDLSDLRNWRSGLHGGTRKVVEGHVQPGGAPA